ncbi:diaminobutyrate/2-oxoglutarate aminotransferase [Desulfurispirillum indicum S5]|uniref:Diaminobutyrate--2-oxoglutarate transaminase n=1 Tax=Desulfurispirillum indicum (strain ATCC BAA-1389 / DSM 22839 / S5) TaxID=653733 RepID=E6W3F9_DESIS|nr:diaminobutyrate--2-oxoglutarate transaminase [Desulfurispirillum indicum]ADU65752.1 diaminobutyrate/2-oxoglutarate aminotransferase [Desulfurispirillum indicum S5]
MRIFEQMESQVRGYIRSFPAIFEKAKGSYLYDEQGNEYIDFFAGAGTLNYGHNNDRVSSALIDYIQKDGVVHGLDMATSAKKRFLQKLQDTVFSPRNLEYKVQFTGPTGTNSVESALKLARMIKNRSNIVAFTNGFHGLSMGSLAVTGNNFYRDEAHISRSNVSFMPYDGYFGPDVNTLDYFRKFLADGSSGLDLPAAVIVETIQAEGGINVASDEWLQGLEQICREFDILLIIDEIQVGNGRSGEFFSFERAGITPDMVTLSKSIGGGLPLALLLMRPELDQWKPGEHTGTFRGNNLAFVASVETLAYWDSNDLSDAIHYKSAILKEELQAIAAKYPDLNCNVRGRGLIFGLEIPELGFAKEVSRIAFEKGLVIELSGADDQVVKFLPPLTIDEETLRKGIAIIDATIGEIISTKQDRLREEF